MALGRKQKSSIPKASGSPGKRLYAIGDVHGCFDEMLILLEKIKSDHLSKGNKSCIIVFLGDLIDRGPKSADVLGYLRQRNIDFADTYFIKGNHEEMMLRTLTGEATLIPAWLRHGGDTCAMSYGINPSQLVTDDPEILEHVLLSHIPREDLRFLETFVDSVSFGDFFLVHAGVRPGITLTAQTGRDLRWIREEFLESKEEFGAVVVHGHTITEEVVRLPNRIGVDTGTYKGGALTAICIEDSDVSFLSVPSFQRKAEYKTGSLA